MNINHQRVYEKIQSVTLPDGVHLTVAPESALMGEVLWLGLTSTDPSVSQSDLRLYAETELRQSLSTVSGISNLLIMGGSAPQYTISVDRRKNRFYITPKWEYPERYSHYRSREK